MVSVFLPPEAAARDRAFAPFFLAIYPLTGGCETRGMFGIPARRASQLERDAARATRRHRRQICHCWQVGVDMLANARRGGCACSNAASNTRRRFQYSACEALRGVGMGTREVENMLPAGAKREWYIQRRVEVLARPCYGAPPLRAYAVLRAHEAESRCYVACNVIPSASPATSASTVRV